MHHSGQRFAHRIFALIVAACLLVVACQAQAIAPVITVDHGQNAPQQISKSYVILVSLDGFRYDYAKRYHAEHLLALAANGASAPEACALPVVPPCERIMPSVVPLTTPFRGFTMTSSLSM